MSESGYEYSHEQEPKQDAAASPEAVVVSEMLASTRQELTQKLSQIPYIKRVRVNKRRRRKKVELSTDFSKLPADQLTDRHRFELAYQLESEYGSDDRHSRRFGLDEADAGDPLQSVPQEVFSIDAALSMLGDFELPEHLNKLAMYLLIKCDPGTGLVNKQLVRKMVKRNGPETARAVMAVLNQVGCYALGVGEEDHAPHNRLQQLDPMDPDTPALKLILMHGMIYVRFKMDNHLARLTDRPPESMASLRAKLISEGSNRNDWYGGRESRSARRLRVLGKISSNSGRLTFALAKSRKYELDIRRIQRMREWVTENERGDFEKEVSTAHLWLAALERQTVIRKSILEALMEFQAEFFRSGNYEDLEEMTQRDIAQTAGVGDSSVSRLLQQAYVITDFGHVYLRDLLIDSLPLVDGELQTRPKAWVLQRLVELIRDEERTYRDRELVDLLSPEVQLQEKTLGNYRNKLSIPDSRTRSQGAMDRLAGRPRKQRPLP